MIKWIQQRPSRSLQLLKSSEEKGAFKASKDNHRRSDLERFYAHLKEIFLCSSNPLNFLNQYCEDFRFFEHLCILRFSNAVLIYSRRRASSIKM